MLHLLCCEVTKRVTRHSDTRQTGRARMANGECASGTSPSDDRTTLNPTTLNPREEHAMLVLTRKNTESILIGERIQIRILKIRGSSIQIGIDAPPHIPIRRSELEPARCLLDFAISAQQSETP